MLHKQVYTAAESCILHEGDTARRGVIQPFTQSRIEVGARYGEAWRVASGRSGNAGCLGWDVGGLRI